MLIFARFRVKGKDKDLLTTQANFPPILWLDIRCPRDAHSTVTSKRGLGHKMKVNICSRWIMFDFRSYHHHCWLSLMQFHMLEVNSESERGNFQVWDSICIACIKIHLNRSTYFLSNFRTKNIVRVLSSNYQNQTWGKGCF